MAISRPCRNVCALLERVDEPARSAWSGNVSSREDGVWDGASDWHRPKTGEMSHFQLDTWLDFAGRLLMFEGMDLKCVVVYQTPTQKDPPPCARYPSAVGSPMRPHA